MTTISIEPNRAFISALRYFRDHAASLRRGDAGLMDDLAPPHDFRFHEILELIQARFGSGTKPYFRICSFTSGIGSTAVISVLSLSSTGRGARVATGNAAVAPAS